jgi:hypothetical protein
MDEVLATIKARPEDEGIYTNYLALESKERLLSGRENDSEFLRAAPLSSTYASNSYGHPSTNEDVLVLSGRQDCEPYQCLQEIMIESEVGESFEEKDTIPMAGGETSISQASDAFVELGVREENMSDSAADVLNGIDYVIRLNHPSESSIENFNSRTSINQVNAISVTEEERIHTSSASFNCSPDYHQFLQQMFIDETQSLSNFERVYPPLESVANYLKYSDIEKYIFEYYEKQHRRMTVPLHQCRVASSEAASSVENSILSASNTNISYRSSARPVDRADSWISGNPYIRKPPPPPPPKELPFPTPKQIETATRLSQSKAPKHAKLRKGDSGDRVQELSDCTNTLSSNARKDLMKASISPINFEFDLLDNITNKSKY